jgi:hypothetical protein
MQEPCQSRDPANPGTPIPFGLRDIVQYGSMPHQHRRLVSRPVIRYLLQEVLSRLTSEAR